MTDKFHGEGGTYRVNAKGERELVKPVPERHEDGDRARDAQGAPDEKATEVTEPALPEPVAYAWSKPKAEKRPDPATGDTPAPKKP
jgi:hypothetical protein